MKWWVKYARAKDLLYCNPQIKNYQLKRRPCTFGQSLWSTNCPVNFTFFGRPIFFLVDQKPISHFFGRPIFFTNQKPFSHVYGRPIFFFFGRPNLFLVNQKKIGWPKKMRNRPNIGRTRDWPKVHGRRLSC